MFIGPFVYDGSESSCARYGANVSVSADDEKAAGVKDMVQAHQPLSGFDFDGLPVRRVRTRTQAQKNAHKATAKSKEKKAKAKVLEQGQEKKGKKTKKRRSLSPQSAISLSTNGKPERWYWALVEWMQVKCGPGNVVNVMKRREKEGQRRGQGMVPSLSAGDRKKVQDLEKAVPPFVCSASPSVLSQSKSNQPTTLPLSPSTPSPPPPPPPPSSSDRRTSTQRKPGQWRLGLRKVYLSVPAFASPLTPVLNPLVGRAQWEIVVRSALLSIVVSSFIVGGLVAVPETHR